jgi:hypothetical protein
VEADVTSPLQFQHAETLHHPDGGNWSKTRHEAEASWSTPNGPGRYRIWHVQSLGGGYYSVVRLKPATGTLNGRALRFSGQSLATVVCSMTEAVAIAERDNARLLAQLGRRRR